jgi:hypothetical protein
VLQHGQTDGPRYRLIDWLADGKRLVVFHADGSSPDRTLGQLDIGHVTALCAAPMGDRVLLANHRNELLLVDLATETLLVLDRSDYGRLEDSDLVNGIAWSPDGRWAAYEQALSAQQVIIKLCRLESGETYQVTDAVRRDTKPAFDPAGRYLYFLSARDFDPVPDAMHFEFSFPRGMRPYLITLRKDLRSPFLPASALLRPEEEEKEAEERQKEKAGKTAAPELVEIDLDGITNRIVAFPVPEGRYGRVLGIRDGALFTSLPVEGLRAGGVFDFKPKSNGSLEWYDFEKHKQEQIADEVGDSSVTADGKMELYYSHDRLRVLKAGEKPPELSSPAADKPGRESGWLDLERIKVPIRPGAEWRLQREQFWVADLAGVDWQGVYARYVHIPDMGADGYAEFHRYYLAEYDHEALIVDVRWNGGGAVSGLVLEKLARPRLGYAFQRWSPPNPYLSHSPRGKLVAITDENAGSDGDIFSHAFKMMGLGPLIGKRTWGGVIGISPYMPLADGTNTTQPEFSFWFKDVGWGVENYGTDPTIDVDYTPQDYALGFDPQLERGIVEALRLIEEYPATTPAPEQHPYRGYPKQ